VIAKPRLVSAILSTSREEVVIPMEGSTLSGERPRQLEGGVKSAEDMGDKPRGTYLQDLDDRRHFSRNETDVAKRELDFRR
jgi:hypothetical protein